MSTSTLLRGALAPTVPTDIEALAERAQTLYFAAKYVDDAYHAELVREYGESEAGDARYDVARHAATSILADLSAAKLAIDSARWRASDELQAADLARLRTVCAQCGKPGILAPGAHSAPTCANCRFGARS